MITFFKDRSLENRTKVEPATGQYIGRYRAGLDVLAQTSYVLVTADAVEANSTTTVINATAHSARPGDAIQITSGTLINDTVFVQSITANAITLSQSLSSAPALSVTFDILRPVFPRVSAAGIGAVTGSGSFSAAQSGTWSVRNQDGSGNALTSGIVPPAITDRGLNIRSIGVYSAPSTATARTSTTQIPHGYYLYSTRITTTGGTTTSVVVTSDASTQCKRGDIVRIASGSHAEGIYEWAIVASVATVTITLDPQTPLSVAPTTGRSIQIWKPGFLSVAVDNSLNVAVSGTVPIYPTAPNKSFFESGEVAFGTLTTTPTSFYTTSNAGYIVNLVNTTDVELQYSLDAGTTLKTIPRDSSVQWNFIDAGGKMDSGVDVYGSYPGPTAPTRGRLSFEMMYY